MRCGACQHENPTGGKFCVECGGALGRRCPACGALASAPARFCAECAEPLGEPTPGTASEAERRQLTVVFCDLVGSTPLAERLDPEDYQAVVRDYQHAVGSAVARFGGYVGQYLGDGAVVYFGWPRAHDDDAERAVRAGLAVQDAIAELNRRLSPGIQTAVRIGIHTGLVVVGEIGVGARDVIALGDVPNVAARVQAAADPGSVLITDAVHRLVSGLFVVEERGTPPMKGVDRPIALFRVRQASGVRGRLDTAPSLTPLVDRVEERARLRELWERARRGEGQAVLLIAEPGIGKSRLVRALKEELVGQAHGWAETGGFSYFQSTPFHPVVVLLRQLLGLREEQMGDERLGALERALEANGLSPLEAVPYLAPLLDIPLPERYAPPLSTVEVQRKKLLATLADWVAAAARLQPIVIVVEDLHWVDPSTLELQTILLARVAALPLLLVYTARREFRAPWAPAAPLTHLALDRLEPMQAREMIAATGSGSLPVEVVDALIARADGVPLFLEELARLVAAQGGDPTAAAGEIPATLHDLLMARLDRLPGARETAQVASVLGREFSYALLQAVAERPDADLERALADLIDADLLYGDGVLPEATYVFKHVLIRDAAYASLLKSRRRELHRTTARMLVERFPDTAATQPELVAHHHGAAGDAEAATAAWQRAAERALSRSALVEAARHYAAALEAIRTLPDAASNAGWELVLQIAEGQVLFATKGFGSPEVERAFARAADLGAQVGGEAHRFVLLGLWASAITRAQLGDALRLADQMQDAAEREGSATARIWSHATQGVTHYHLGEVERSGSQLSQALALSDEARQPTGVIDPAVMALAYLSHVELHRGRVDAADRRIAEAVALAKQLDKAPDLAWARVYELGLYAQLREPAPVLERAEEVLRLARDQAMPIFVAAATLLGGWATAQLGRHEEGIVELRRGIGIYTGAGQRLQVSFYLTLLAECLEDEPIEVRMAAASDALEAVGEEELERADVLRLRAELLVLEGARPETVERSFREATETARRLGTRLYELRATTALARWLRTQGRVAEAHAVLAPLCASLPEGLETRDFREADALVAELDKAARTRPRAPSATRRKPSASG